MFLLQKKLVLIIFIVISFSNSPGDSGDQLCLGLVGTSLVSLWGEAIFCLCECLSVLISHVHEWLSDGYEDRDLQVKKPEALK